MLSKNILSLMFEEEKEKFADRQDEYPLDKARRVR